MSFLHFAWEALKALCATVLLGRSASEQTGGEL